MTKRSLFLMRHGKAAWPDGIADHDRPLAPRGIAAVPMIAARLAEITTEIDLVLVSDARRTRETCQRMAEVLLDLSIRIEPSIYEARPGTLLDLVQRLPESAETVLLIGHNPGFHALALYLADSKTSVGEALRRLERKLPTAGLVHLEWEGDWADGDHGRARLVHFITPATLGGVDED